MSGLFGKKGQNTAEKRLNAIQISRSAYGNPIPLVYGKTRISGSLIWYGNFLATPHTQSQGGKGGGGGSSTSYTYSAALAMLLCEGPISSIATAMISWRQRAVAAASASRAACSACRACRAALSDFALQGSVYL